MNRTDVLLSWLEKNDFSIAAVEAWCELYGGEIHSVDRFAVIEQNTLPGEGQVIVHRFDTPEKTEDYVGALLLEPETFDWRPIAVLDLDVSPAEELGWRVEVSLEPRRKT